MAAVILNGFNLTITLLHFPMETQVGAIFQKLNYPLTPFYAIDANYNTCNTSSTLTSNAFIAIRTITNHVYSCLFSEYCKLHHPSITLPSTSDYSNINT